MSTHNITPTEQANLNLAIREFESQFSKKPTFEGLTPQRVIDLMISSFTCGYYNALKDNNKK